MQSKVGARTHLRVGGPPWRSPAELKSEELPGAGQVPGGFGVGEAFNTEAPRGPSETSCPPI